MTEAIQDATAPMDREEILAALGEIARLDDAVAEAKANLKVAETKAKGERARLLATLQDMGVPSVSDGEVKASWTIRHDLSIVDKELAWGTFAAAGRLDEVLADPRLDSKKAKQAAKLMGLGPEAGFEPTETPVLTVKRVL